MTQGILPFKYYEEKKCSGMTALAGLPPYLDLAFVSGLTHSIATHLHIRDGVQGWSDVEMIMSLILLNIAGGSCVNDLRILRKDEGFVSIVRASLTRMMRRRDRQKLEKKWQKGDSEKTIPSPSAAFRYLSSFKSSESEMQRTYGTAFIPAPTEHLQGLAFVNTDFLSYVQHCNPVTEATLDMDATLAETHKDSALFCYKGYKAYQPHNVYWAEQRLIVHSEFRDGNVPAGYEQLRVLKDALSYLPDGVKKVNMRSDTAGYQVELLKYCAEGRHPQYGVIDFAVGAPVSPEFKSAVLQVPEKEWHPLFRMVKGEPIHTGHEWAEVCFVPNWAGSSKKGPDYRFIAIREPLRQLELPGISEQLEFPFPTAFFKGNMRYKLHGIVTNRTTQPGDEVIFWYWARCGKSEEVHAVMKEDLAGGKLPSDSFGVNAAWWAIMILAYNLNMAMKTLVLGKNWVNARMKAIRFSLINLPGRIVHHARELIVRLTGGHDSTPLLIEIRRKILALWKGE